MEFSRLSSLLVIIGAVNIFYAMYGFMHGNWVNALIPLATYLILIYSAAIVETEVGSQRLARSVEEE